jgi:cytochrome c oxidase cbb3-type subunit 2
MPSYSWLAQTELDLTSIATDLKVQALLGVPYTKEMIDNARADVAIQASTDNPDSIDLAKRYPKVQSRDFDGNPGRVSEEDALIAYLQMLGTQVDFKLYSDKANIR